MKWMGRTVMVMLVVILAACNFSRTTNEKPTIQPTVPVMLVTTPLPTPTNTLDVTITLTPPPTFTPPPTASFTPWPATATPQPVINTPTLAPPTAIPPTVAPPTALPMAQVCETCGQLRLRQSPGTAGSVITNLAALTPLNVIGRTTDSAWIQVALNDGRSGWVASQYLVVNVDLSAVSVTGVAEDVAVPVSSGSSYISGVSFHARQIYLDGQSKGNRANTFSKVGDSITYSWAYLYPLASNYSLADYDYLSPALGFFSGPNGRGENCFGASPIAAYPGWTTRDLLTPGGAKTGACGPGETPLECEYRTAQPSVAVIMLGTNDVAQNMSLDTFRANLQRIVDISISRGVIPVLSTIPPFPVLDGNARAFNEVIIATARANDIPLWDFYSSINGLPNRGLSPDGVHPSEAPDNHDAYFDAEHLQYGFTVRNLGTLQILYELWRQVLYDSGTTLPAGPPPGPAPTAVDVGPVDPASYSCPGAPPIRLHVGEQGRVTPGVPNKLRNAPGLSGAEIGNIPGEGVFTVTGGPHCADGFTWWQVNYNGTVGWTASGNSSEYWVEPYP
jgi:uncharacterized protein YraI